MALTISAPIFIISRASSSSSSSWSNKKWRYCCYSSSSSPNSVLPCKTSNFGTVTNPLLGFFPFSSWSGLRQMGFSISTKSFNPVRERRCKGKGVHASLFGVGAPEALVIGVVALLVFGPKGLAEVARNLGKTLREFQPTIRELQDVSREFKSTLEREIGLDDLSISSQNTYNSNITKRTSAPEDSGVVPDLNGVPPPNKAYTSEEYLKITEEQLRAAAAAQQAGQTYPPSEDVPQTPNKPQGSIEEVTAEVTPEIPPSSTSDKES